MANALRYSRLAPWSGLIAGAGGWLVHQQVLADLLHFDCRLGGPAAGLLAGAAVGIAMIGAGLVSWRARGKRDEHDAPAQTRHFVALLSSMAAALFLLVVLLQTLATLMIPPCRP